MVQDGKESDSVTAGTNTALYGFGTLRIREHAVRVRWDHGVVWLGKVIRWRDGS